MTDYLSDLQTYKPNEKKYKKSALINNRLCLKPDPVLLKLHPTPHPLSSEQQYFYLKMTEGVFGFSEQVRNESLQILACDYHVTFLAPYLCVFLKTTVEINIIYPNLSLLIYSIRMVKSLITNPYIDIKKQLHLLIPLALSCVLSKKISKYNYDNHWTLRDFSAQIIATMCSNFSNKANEIKKRVVKIYMKAIQDPQKSITTLYGGLKGITCLGDDMIKVCIIPLMPILSKRIYILLEKNSYLGENSIDVKQIKRVSDMIICSTGSIFLAMDNSHDGGMHYVQKYGYLGYNLYNYVKNLEKLEIDKMNPFCKLFNI